MFKNLFLFSLIIIIFSFATGAPSAQAQVTDMSEALKRMDTIIAEMSALRSEFASIALAMGQVAPKPSVLGASSANVFTKSLAYGEDNEDIKTIQKLLSTDINIYPYGVASGFFGPKTQEAIRNFQSRFGLDPVGIIGPATKSLLSLFITAYPDGNYPTDVLKMKPKKKVLGASISKPVTNIMRSIIVSEDSDEYIVKSFKKGGKRNRDLILYPKNSDDLVEMIAKKLSISENEVRSLIDVGDFDFGNKKSNYSDDEEGAKNAINDANTAIRKARTEIRDADEKGDNTKSANILYKEAKKLYREAKAFSDTEDYSDAVESAGNAKDAANDAIDEIGGSSSKNSDKIDTIEVRIKKESSKISVQYDNGDSDAFTVDETDKEDIVTSIADKLDLDESDVSKTIDFEYGDIKNIFVQIDTNKSRVTVYFQSGLRLRFTVNEEEESDIVRAIARKIGSRKSDVENDIEFE